MVATCWVFGARFFSQSQFTVYVQNTLSSEDQNRRGSEALRQTQVDEEPGGTACVCLCMLNLSIEQHCCSLLLAGI